MADVVALPRPTRTAGEVDLPPCGNRWGPNDCVPGRGRPRRHVCWTWSGWPHICRCTRCGPLPDRWRHGIHDNAKRKESQR